MIRTERTGPVLQLVLDRPGKRNAITTAMYGALTEALRAAETDGTRIIVLSGTGEGFCAGNDLADFLAGDRAAAAGAAMAFLTALHGSTRVLVAAVQGHAAGVGATLLLHCDLVLAGPDAVLSFPFVDRALVPEAASSLLLPRLLGHGRAAALLLLGESLSATDAAAAGLIAAVVPAGRLAAETQALVARLAQKPAQALLETRRLLHREPEPVADRMAEEAAAFATQLRGPEMAAAIGAFLAKRSGGP